MIINEQKLIHLPVFTESGEKLGTIHDFEIDVDTHHIRKYIVEPRFIGKDKYLITPTQIKSITEEKIIVVDTILKDADVAPGKSVVPPTLDIGMPSTQKIKLSPKP